MTGPSPIAELPLLGAVGEAPDGAVRRWLATVTVPDDLAAARRLRDQIHEVSRALPGVADAALAEAARSWVTEKPRLLPL
jgi:hypothetical protein